MAYREYVKIIFNDGTERVYHDVYVKESSNGFRISDYSDFSNEDFIPYSNLNESECKKANPNEGCFISTAVYHFQNNPEPNLRILKDFRDHTMRNRLFANKMIKLYYNISPPIANYLCTNRTQSEFIKKYFIDNSVLLIQKMNNARNSGKKLSSLIYESSIYLIYSFGLFTSWILFKARR